MTGDVWRAMVFAVVLLMAAQNPVLAERVTRNTALDALTELYAAYYINERCNVVSVQDEAFVGDVEQHLISAAALSRPDLEAVYLSARRMASVGACDTSLRQRVLRAYDFYRKKYVHPEG